MFLLDKSLSDKYFTKISVTRYNIYQNNMYLIGLSNNRDKTINPSSQFN